MHSAFIWASCNNENAIESLAQLVHPPVPPQNLPEYFWMHLERDLEDLSKITGRGIDECSVIVHLVLRDILTKEPLKSEYTAIINPCYLISTVSLYNNFVGASLPTGLLADTGEIFCQTHSIPKKQEWCGKVLSTTHTLSLCYKIRKKELKKQWKMLQVMKTKV